MIGRCVAEVEVLQVSQGAPVMIGRCAAEVEVLQVSAARCQDTPVVIDRCAAKVEVLQVSTCGGQGLDTDVRQPRASSHVQPSASNRQTTLIFRNLV